MGWKGRLLIVVLVVVALLYYGNLQQLSFTATNVDGVQYIGSIPESYPSSLAASSEIVVGDYRVTTEQSDSYIGYAGSICKENSCGGTAIGNDAQDCSIYSKTNARTTLSCSESARPEGSFCWFSGCGYYTRNCLPDTSQCNATENDFAECIPGSLTENLCFSSTRSDVRYNHFIDCLQDKLSCGGFELKGPSAFKLNQCATKYKVYHKDILVKEVLGQSVHSNYVLSPVIIGFRQGDEAVTNSADVIFELHQSASPKGSPSRCEYTTNGIILNIKESHFDINVSANIIPQQESSFSVAIENNYAQEVLGLIEVTYTMQTALGTVQKKEKRLLSVPLAGASLTVPINSDISSENVEASVHVDILQPGSSFKGFNIPAQRCYLQEGDIYQQKQGGGTLGAVESCAAVKLGETTESFSIQGEIVKEVPNPPVLPPLLPPQTSIFQQIIGFFVDLFRQLSSLLS